MYILYIERKVNIDMVFKEEAYKEVFPDVVVAPVAPKQESMISDDQEDAKTVEEPKQVEQAQVPVEEPKQETMQPEQEEGKE